MRRIAKLILAVVLLVFTFGAFNQIGSALDSITDINGFNKNTFKNDNLYVGMEKAIYGNDVDPFENVFYRGYIDGDNNETTDVSPVQHYIFHGVDIKKTALSIQNELSENTHYQVSTSVRIELYLDSDNYLDTNLFVLHVYGIEYLTLMYEDGTSEALQFREQEVYLDQTYIKKRDTKIGAIFVSYGELETITNHDAYILNVERRPNQMQINFFENYELQYTKVLREQDMIENKNYSDYVIYDLTELVNKYCDLFAEWKDGTGNYIEVSIKTPNDIQSAYYNLEKSGVYLFKTPTSQHEALNPVWSEKYYEVD